jgi:ubiquinone/menaquinone biosynthesis C-methylase UbiE
VKVSEKHPGVEPGLEPEGGWREHMHFDAESRRSKAHKIVATIAQEHAVGGARILEIGTGTGVISAELAKAVGPEGLVVSIDTMDTRVDSVGYSFMQISGVLLPFSDASFDIVVSNHVIEHVGGRENQMTHLNEIRRVMRSEGVAYLATPTRWALIEPHFKVPMLSWPPRQLRDTYLRLTRRGLHYDVDPFGRRELRKSVATAGLVFEDRTTDALTQMLHLETPPWPLRILAHLPSWFLRLLRPILPTVVCVARPPAHESFPP